MIPVFGFLVGCPRQSGQIGLLIPNGPRYAGVAKGLHSPFELGVWVKPVLPRTISRRANI